MSGDTIPAYPDFIIFEAIKQAIKEWKDTRASVRFVKEQIRFAQPQWTEQFIDSLLVRLEREGMINLHKEAGYIFIEAEPGEIIL